MPEDAVPISIFELDQQIAETLDHAQARIDAYEERAAIQREERETTDQHAWKAIQRPERFRGEHAIASTWLKNSPTARIWSAKGDE